MALIKRAELPALLKSMEQDKVDGKIAQLFLFFGERYLCREAADILQNGLLARPAGGAVNVIDGDNEDSSRTLGQLMNFSLLPGLQIFRVTDSRLFHSKTVASAIWTKVIQARDAKKDTACARQLLSFLSIADLGIDEHLGEMSSSQWKTLFGFEKPSGN